MFPLNGDCQIRNMLYQAIVKIKYKLDQCKNCFKTDFIIIKCLWRQE